MVNDAILKHLTANSLLPTAMFGHVQEVGEGAKFPHRSQVENVAYTKYNKTFGNFDKLYYLF